MESKHEREIGQPCAEGDWQQTAEDLRQAIIMISGLDEKAVPLVGETFWADSSHLMKQLDEQTPGIAEQVIAQTEALAASRQQTEIRRFEEVDLPRTKRKAFLRGFLNPFG